MQDQLMPVSMRLKAARQAVNLSTQDVSNRTHIPEKYVIAIDEGDWQLLPDMVYAKGYAKTYARCVGINQDELIAQLDAAIKPAVPDPADLQTNKPAKLFAKKAVRVPQPGNRGSALKWIKGLTLLIALMVLAWLLWLLVNGLTYNRQSVAPVASVEAPPVTAPVALPPVDPAAAALVGNALPGGQMAVAPNVAPVAPVTGPIAKPNPQRHTDKLVLRAAKDTHVEVRDEGGNVVVDADTAAGESLTVTGYSPYSIETSEAGDVNGTLNNEPLPREVNERKRVRVTTP